jgi:type IV pilus assembly protein PilE
MKCANAVRRVSNLHCRRAILVSRARVVGFTLVELMIVVIVLAIIAAIAIPAYQNQVVRANRTEARTALLQASQALERCFTRFNGYDAASGCPVTFPIMSETGLYQVTDTVRTATAYTLTAVPQGLQATRDTLCGSFTLNQTGLRGISGGTGTVAQCW